MDEANEERPETCDCEYPARWAANPDVPIRFDERFREFSLKYDDSELYLRYCFWCGGKLPESKRPDFFTKPHEAELAEIARLLAGAKTIDQAFAAVGPPDRTMDWEEPPVHHDHEKLVRWRRCHTYGSRWKTVDLTLLEMPDGSFTRMTGGRWIGPLKKDGEGACGGEACATTKPRRRIVRGVVFSLIAIGMLVVALRVGLLYPNALGIPTAALVALLGIGFVWNAISYFGAGPRVFGTREDGTFPGLLQVLLGPYLIVAWLVCGAAQWLGDSLYDDRE